MTNISLNYTDIILNGYANTNTRNHLDKYFYRQFKQAESGFFEATEFFEGCLTAVQIFENDIQQQIHERKKELHLMLSQAKSRTINFNEDHPELTYENRCLDLIKYCENELSYVSENNYYVTLIRYLGGKYRGHLSYSDLQEIKTAISLTQEKENLQSEQCSEPKQERESAEMYQKKLAKGKALIHQHRFDGKKFVFSLVKEHLQTLPHLPDQLKYLYEVKAGFLQETAGFTAEYWLYNTTYHDRDFAKLCDIEIEKIKALTQQKKSDFIWQTVPTFSDWVKKFEQEIEQAMQADPTYDIENRYELEVELSSPPLTAYEGKTGEEAAALRLFFKKKVQYLQGKIKALQTAVGLVGIATIPSGFEYKRHPEGLDLIQIPPQIKNSVYPRLDYQYIQVKGYGKVPIPRFLIDLVDRKCPNLNVDELMCYAQGFFQGYNTDLKPFIDTPSSRLEYIIREANKTVSSFCQQQHKTGLVTFDKNNILETGISEGRRYKAWEIIFQTPDHFIQFSKEQVCLQEKAKEISQPEREISENDKPLQIKNNFDAVKIDVVYKHFYSELVEKKYLSEADLKSYLTLAFEKKEIPKTRYKLIDTTKTKVMKVFYNYYKNTASKPYKRQQEYAALLGEYFEGYKTENVRTNFNK